jgi:hypothetical protein
MIAQRPAEGTSCVEDLFQFERSEPRLAELSRARAACNQAVSIKIHEAAR